MIFQCLILSIYSIILHKLNSTLNMDIKGTEKLKGPFKQNCTYLEHDVQSLHTSITIDVHHRKIFI